MEEKIRNVVNESLNDAEKIWDEVGEHFTKKAKALMEMRANVEKPSSIPGFPFVEDGKPKVANYIALVLDIRDSTKHLTQAISEKVAKASQLERVLYETTAINTMGSMIAENYNGKITEFLGDGFLALYKVENENNARNEINFAHNSAKKCIGLTKKIVNEIIRSRYNLPPLKIGVGLAYSKAIVTLVGHGENLHPKALGECVYRASKLSSGYNEILIDDRLENLWPTSKAGKLRFTKSTKQFDFNAYKIERAMTN